VAGSSTVGGARGLTTMSRLDSVDDGTDVDVDVDVDEKLEFEKEDDRRTSDSRSMV